MVRIHSEGSTKGGLQPTVRKANSFCLALKTTTVYRGPGYPVDPKKEEQRMFKECIMRIPRPSRRVKALLDAMDKTIDALNKAYIFNK